MATHVCELVAEGVTVRWVFRPSARDTETVIVFAEINAGPAFKTPPIRSTEFAMSLRDIETLATYLHRHISELTSNAAHRSDILITYDLGYQIEAGEGDLRGEGDDKFALTVLLNVGTTISGTRLYMGSRSQISAASALRFVAETRQVIATARE